MFSVNILLFDYWQNVFASRMKKLCGQDSARGP